MGQKKIARLRAKMFKAQSDYEYEAAKMWKMEQAEAVKDIESAVAMRWTPPSNTMVQTKDNGWYVTMSYDEVMDRLKTALSNDYENGGRAFIEFDVVSHDARRICVDFAAITAVLDMTPVDTALVVREGDASDDV